VSPDRSRQWHRLLAQDVATTAHEMGYALGIADHFTPRTRWVSGNFGVENEDGTRAPHHPRDVNTRRSLLPPLAGPLKPEGPTKQPT
jgi:hypothetical protein